MLESLKLSIPNCIKACWKRRSLRVVAIVIASTIALYMVGGFIGVPLLLRHVVLSRINDKLVGTLEVERIRFNPFSWQLSLHEFHARSPNGVEAASFAEFRINLQASTLLADTKVIHEVHWDRPSCTLSIAADGQVNLASVFGLKQPEPEQDSKPLVLPALLIERLEIRDAGMCFLLANETGGVQRELEQVSLVMENIRTTPERENPYRFDLSTDEGEQLSIEGALRFDPLSSTGKVTLSTLQLADFSGFLGGLTSARIERGELDSALQYVFQPLAAKPAFGIKEGRLELRDLLVAEDQTGEGGQAIGLLQLEGIHFDIVGRTAGIGSILLDEASLLLLRAPGDGFRLLPRPQSSSPTPSADTGEAPDAQAAAGLELGVVAADKDMGLSIETALTQLRQLDDNPDGAREQAGLSWSLGSCQVKNSQLRIQDRSLTPVMALSLDQIACSAGPYDSSSREPLPFDIQLQLAADTPGSLRAKGSTLPAAPLRATQLQVTAEKLPLRPFAGHLVAAIGRPTTGGSLSGSLEGELKHGLIKIDNQLRIHCISLGPRVEGSEAPHLPLDLAMAILEDREHIIHIDIPVSGDLKSPEFSTSRMVSYAIGNVIEKVVSKPFDLLGGLLPGDDQKIAPVQFKDGSAELPKSATRKLEAIAAILAKRPRLGLTLTPGFSAKQDTKPLSEHRFERKLAAEMAKGLDRKDAIKALNEQLPDSKRVSSFGFGKTREMEAAVRESLAATESELKDLARQRAEAVREALKTLGVAPERVQLAAEPEPESREVDFGVLLAP